MAQYNSNKKLIFMIIDIENSEKIIFNNIIFFHKLYYFLFLYVLKQYNLIILYQ